MGEGVIGFGERGRNSQRAHHYNNLPDSYATTKNWPLQTNVDAAVASGMTFVVVCCCVPLPFRPTLSHAHPRGRAQTAILRDFFVLKCFPSCDFKMHLSLSGTTMNNGFTRDSLVPWLRQTHMRLAMTEETIFKLLGLLIYIGHIIKAVIERSFFFPLIIIIWKT